MKRLFFSIVFLVPFCTWSQKIDNVHIEEYDLPNGLHVILHKDVNEPNVIVGTKYHVGSKNEDVDKTGFAHFFEHLLFHGTKNIPQGELENIIFNAGGYCNAYTNYDVTYYYQLLPAHEYKLGLWVESERMLHPIITQKGIDREREIVKEEKRMRYDNKPLGNSYFEVMSELFTYDTYGHNIIGSMEDLDRASLEDFDGFFKRFYVPNNACLVVSGNINIEDTKKWVSLYFKDIPKGEKIKRPKKFKKPSISDPHTDITVKGLQNESIEIAYPIMSQSSADAPVMQIITSILSGNSDFSYFENNLKTKQDTVIDRLRASASFWEKVGTLNVKAEVKTRESGAYALQRINEQFELLKTRPVDPMVLERAKKQFIATYIDIFYDAQTFADKVTNYYHLHKNTSDIRALISDIEKVTSSDIQRVAKKYLDTDRRIVMSYHPE
ncbi:M16 family metallopeptidase [Pseudozobellia thermophila]|uniref:Predicted Zn-dependent peptidase n=1 Tax=Pseudozobellia thermophila TaxID=192903 RepID=A0A1M6EMS2_9FLAO|nr:pitrilysin family protein [Pseudozobellia thermophila]SHI86792.1 Predicted Zn-dependent peptidase [Pseudozobellia thermophila]